MPLVETLCPLCQTADFDHQLYAMNFRPEELSGAIFSARRRPDRLHYRMVRCGGCGLLRSNPILDSDELSSLYRGSHFTYGDEAGYTRQTYGRYLARALALTPQRASPSLRGLRGLGPKAPASRLGWTEAYSRLPNVLESSAPRASLMEIGCGSGFFLEEALELGFAEVHGIEPCTEAIAHAADRIRPVIKQGLYGADTFEAGSFDMICAFQVFDHVPDPAAMLAACREDLKPGGIAFFINHDSRALSAFLLGELSPIVDVEHTVLFDKRTMAAIFELQGFTVLDIFSVKNRYPLKYWMKLAPLPAAMKSPLLEWISSSRMGDLPITLSAGNLGLVAMKAGSS